MLEKIRLPEDATPPVVRSDVLLLQHFGNNFWFAINLWNLTKLIIRIFQLVNRINIKLKNIHLDY